MSSKNSAEFVVLMILDGWGIAPKSPGNAIELANNVNFNKFWVSYPRTQLDASGKAVGLPRGEPGNTETGHLNLGAGRIVYQDLERINMAIAEGSFFENKILLGAIEHAQKNKSDLHYIGLLGAGGVHSNIEHLFALIQLAKKRNFPRLYLHLFTDGRDSPPTSAQTYFDKLESVIKKEGVGKIASLMGRFWAMDRDQRWDRTKKAYFALTKGEGNKFSSVKDAINKSYKSKKTDEFIEPSIIVSSDNNPIALVKDNDACIFINFRIDRPRQLTKAFVLNDFTKAHEYFKKEETPTYLEGSDYQTTIDKVKLFERGPKLKNLYFSTMTEYSKVLSEEGVHPAFPPEQVDHPLGSVLSIERYEQLRITESEKERFVTFYFNGLKEKPFPGEHRIIIPSPKVVTYDQKPEMSSKHLTDVLLREIKRKKYKFILVNYPNADIVGHTGNLEQTIKAIDTVDKCISEIASLVLTFDGVLLITADHGNAEELINPHTGEIDTEHSSNPVPFIAISKRLTGRSMVLTSGILADVSPTILALLGIKVPNQMSGKNLLQEVWNQ